MYFRPLPQWQRSLRPRTGTVFGAAIAARRSSIFFSIVAARPGPKSYRVARGGVWPAAGPAGALSNASITGRPLADGERLIPSTQAAVAAVSTV